MLSPCQQFINSIELWTVAHVLMDFLDVGQDTVKEKKKPTFVRISQVHTAILGVKRRKVKQSLWNH